MTIFFPQPLEGVDRVMDIIGSVNGGYTGMFSEARRLTVLKTGDGELAYTMTNELVTPNIVETFKVTVVKVEPEVEPDPEPEVEPEPTDPEPTEPAPESDPA